jgi:hypothetical protein
MMFSHSRETAPRLLVALSVVPIADHPNGRDGFLWIRGKDNPPVSVADYDLSPAGQTSPQWKAGVLPNLLESEEFLQEEGKVTALGVAGEIVDRLVDELDADRHLVRKIVELISGIAQALKNLVEGVPRRTRSEHAGGSQ